MNWVVGVDGCRAGWIRRNSVFSPPSRPALNGYTFKKAALDDIIDAHIACWTAERIRRGIAERIPADPQTDSKNLRMEIWY